MPRGARSGAWGYGPSVATSAQAVIAIRDRAAAAADGVEPEELRSRRYVRAAFQPGWPFTLSDPDQTPDPPPPSLPGPRGGTRPPPSSSSLAERREEGGRFALGDEEAEAALAMQEMRESALEYKLVSKVQAGWDRLFPGSVDWELGWRLHLTALGVIQQPQLREDAAPLGFIGEASRRVDYLRGLAQDALQNQDYTLARALVAEAKLESSGGDEESRQAVQELAEEVERRCLDQPFDYS